MSGQNDVASSSTRTAIKEAHPIRVLHLCSSAGLYGAERWTLALVKWLRQTRIQSMVSILRKEPLEPPILCEQASLLGLQTVVFEAPERLSWQVIGQLRRLMRENRIAILHTHGYKTDIIGLIGVWGTGVKIISTPHGWTVNASLKLRIYEAFDRLIFPFFDAVAPVSQGLCEGLRRLPGVWGKTRLIEGGIDLDEIDSVPQTRAEILRWQSEGRFVIGYLGRLVEGKGLHALLNAVARLDASRVRLVIVGDGELRVDLERFAVALEIAQITHFFGFRDDRLAFLRGFDVCVLPSRSEGLPQCLMEAMAFGVPVLASDIPGCRALVDDQVTGILCPVDDAECLAEKLLALAGDPALRGRLGQAGRSLVRAKYSAEVMAAHYASLYQSILVDPRFSDPIQS